MATLTVRHGQPSRVSVARIELAKSLFPVSTVRSPVIEPIALFVLGTVAAFFRWGSGALQGRVWAEDGTVFLGQAYAVGPIRSLSVQYAGYLSVVPRIAAGVVYLLPITWQGVALHVAAAIVQSAVGVVAYVATSGHIASRWARGLLAACVVAVPVGPEVTGNIANLQWFVMFGAGVALLWSPRTRWGWVVIAALGIAATTSSPFGFIILLAAIVRYFIQRGRPMLWVIAATAVGFAVQTAAMIHAPTRKGLVRNYAPWPLLHGYLSRVLGDGVFGVGRFTPPTHSGTVLPGVVVLGAAAALIVVARIRNPRANYWVVIALVCLSVLTYLAPVVSSSPNIYNPFGGGRYYVTPALFAEAALLLLVARAVESSGDTGCTLSRNRTWLGWAPALLVVAALAFGLSTSYENDGTYSRNVGPSWIHLVHSARQECTTKPPTALLAIPIEPQGWTILLRCAQLS